MNAEGRDNGRSLDDDDAAAAVAVAWAREAEAPVRKIINGKAYMGYVIDLSYIVLIARQLVPIQLFLMFKPLYVFCC
jgi:hypothetical protein